MLITQVDQWLDFSTSIVSGAGLEAVCGVVDQFLSLRTYLVGYQLSIADLQIWGQLQGTSMLTATFYSHPFQIVILGFAPTFLFLA